MTRRSTSTRTSRSLRPFLALATAATALTVMAGTGPAGAFPGGPTGYCSPHPTPSASAMDDFVYEHQLAWVEVKLSNASCTYVTVDYTTWNGPSAAYAKAGIDYHSTSGKLTFSPGQTSKFVPVSIIDDNLYENNEIFYVRLVSASGATLGDAWGKVTISGLEPAG